MHETWPWLRTVPFVNLPRSEYGLSLKVREPGLWNSNHVDNHYELGFLSTLATLVRLISTAHP
jgi:hypothetical protein